MEISLKNYVSYTNYIEKTISSLKHSEKNIISNLTNG